MVKPKHWRIVALSSTVIFALWVLSHLLCPMGGIFTKASLVLRPFDSDIRLEAVRRSRTKAGKGWQKPEMHAALKLLRSSIHRNPFNYLARFESFQVLRALEALGEDTSDAAMTAMRTTLILRWKDPRVAVAGMRFAFSRWPLLSAQDREFFCRFFSRMVKVMRIGHFESILKAWGRYSRDMDLLETALDQRPEFSQTAAKTLAKLQANRDDRLRFLARYEAWAVKHFKEKLQQRINAGEDNYDTWKTIADQLSKAVDGYSRLVEDYKDSYAEFRNVMDRLELNMVTALTGSMEWSRRVATRREILGLVERMLKRPAATPILKELSKRLERTRFFAQSDLDVLELRLRMLFMMGEFPTVASLGSAEMAKRHYVPPEEADAVQRIFLIYVRALRRMNKPEEAARAVGMIRERTGSSPQLTWMEFLLDHPDAIDSGSAAWMNLPEEVRDSFRIPISRNRTVRTTVYPALSGELMIQVQADADSILDASHLVMVYVDGRLTAERYVRELPPGAVWKIKLPENPERLPVNVEIRIK